MSKDFTSGAEPEQLRQLFSLGLEESLSEQKADHIASLDIFMEKPGSRIGRYKLLSILGEGGMGIVYLAQQHQPVKRQVAVKIIKPGMDSKRVIARFEEERQVLALLEHPNIAHVFDAGTTKAGRLYFVMEYVKGLPITEHCDRYKLTIEDRLMLFRQVCLAVHHAHQKGIIHRDIKPSNILVTTHEDQAVPKIIDFGVAKAVSQPLTERTLCTEQGQLFGTPEYMSPEQADMASEDIDIRSDIYSLGVLLYVLLTGILPFDSDTLREGGIDHIRQIIRETDPKTPSTRLTKLGDEGIVIAQNRQMEIQKLARHLRNELEWIPLKAMRKERTERYRSASEFADDINNYLKSAPLIAGPLSTMYRFKKFVRRNKALVGGIFAVVMVSLIGAFVSLIFAMGQARARSEAQAVADFLTNDVLASLGPGKTKGSEVTVLYVLDAASENIVGKLKDEPLVEASIREMLGWTYRNIGESKAAEIHLERSLQIRQEHLGAEHPDTLTTVGKLAWLRMGQGRATEAAELLEEALLISQHLLGDENIKTLTTVNALGCVYKDLGRCEEAEQLYLKNIIIARRVLGDKNGLSLLMMGNLGQVYEDQERYDDAERQYIETLRLRDGTWDDKYIYTLLYKSFLARVYMRQKRYDEAERLYSEILPIQRRVDGNHQLRTLWSIIGFAQVNTHLSKYSEAEKLFTEALAVLQSSGHWYTKRLCMNGLAALYAKQGIYNKAEPLLKESLEICIRRIGDDHPHTLKSWNNLVELYEAWNKPDKADEWRAKLPQTEAVE